MCVRYKSLYISFLSSTKQQRELDDQVLRCLRNVDDDGLFFVFPFGIERRRYMCRCRTFLGPLAHQTDLGNREFHLLNINSFFTGRCPRRRRRRCLNSLFTRYDLLAKYRSFLQTTVDPAGSH